MWKHTKVGQKNNLQKPKKKRNCVTTRLEKRCCLVRSTFWIIQVYQMWYGENFKRQRSRLNYLKIYF
jgi:hypothetical protein